MKESLARTFAVALAGAVVGGCIVLVGSSALDGAPSASDKPARRELPLVASTTVWANEGARIVALGRPVAAGMHRAFQSEPLLVREGDGIYVLRFKTDKGFNLTKGFSVTGPPDAGFFIKMRPPFVFTPNKDGSQTLTMKAVVEDNLEAYPGFSAWLSSQ
jgi:hypothetical protein